MATGRRRLAGEVAARSGAAWMAVAAAAATPLNEGVMEHVMPGMLSVDVKTKPFPDAFSAVHSAVYF